MAEPLLEHALLEKLERLSILSQKSLPGLVGGHNTSRFSGAGQEFLDHRNFHQGDDLRAVNWRAFMRLEKLFLKMFQLEPRIPVRLLLDISNSMETGAIAKFHYARQLAGAMCYTGLVRLDSIYLQPFSNKLHDGFPAGGGRHRYQPASNFLMSLKPQGSTNFLDVSKSFISEFPQRGLVIVISDFLDDADCEKPLQFLSDFGHELILVQVYADEDRNPPWEGELEIEDAETGQKVELAFDDDTRARYTAEFDQYSEHLRKIALRNSGRYVSVATSEPLEQAIFGQFLTAGALQ